MYKGQRKSLNKKRIDAREMRLVDRMGRVEKRLDSQDNRIRAVEWHMHGIDKQMARIGGVLEGWRESLVRRASEV